MAYCVCARWVLSFALAILFSGQLCLVETGRTGRRKIEVPVVDYSAS